MVVLLKRKIFAAVFPFAPQSDTDRLPSFKEGSCRRRRLRGVATRQEVIFMSRSRYCFGLCRGVFCGSAARQPLPSSGRKVSRVSVTEGERETERRRKTESGSKTKVSHSPSVAFGASSLSEGACELVRFSALFRRENKGNFRDFKSKNLHIFLSVAVQSRCHKPSSGRKVSRVSVTEGERGTEKRRKTESRALSFRRLRRQLPLGGSLQFVRFFPFC